MSQPAVSAALGRLRKVFGDPLFVRGSHSMQPTARALQLGAFTARSARFDQARPAAAVGIRSRNGRAHARREHVRRRRARLPAEIVRAIAGNRAGHQDTQRYHAGDRTRAGDGVGDVDLAIGYFPSLKGAGIYQQRLFSHTFACAVRTKPSTRRAQDHAARVRERVARCRGGQDQRCFRGSPCSHRLETPGCALVAALSCDTVIVRDSDLIVTVPYAIAATFAGVGGLRTLRPPIQGRDACPPPVLACAVPPRSVQPVVARPRCRAVC